MATVTNTPLTLSWFIPGITTTLLTYNRIQWWRSVDGELGTYEAATETTAAAATLLGRNNEPHLLAGKTLEIVVDGDTTYEVTFAGPDPYTTADAVAEILAVTSALLTPSDAAGYLLLTTVNTGSAASIVVTETEGSLALGLQDGDQAVGTDQNGVLVGGTHEYFFEDANSDTDFWYKIKLRASGGPQESPFSVAFPATETQAVPYSDTIVGWVRLADVTGRPVVGQRITIYQSPLPNLIGLFNVLGGPQVMDTDTSGYSEMRLLRGAVIDVSVEGTGLVRRITVPSTGDGFNLLDPGLTADDEFSIHQPAIAFANRTS